MVLSNDLSEEISLKVLDKGTMLLNYFLRKKMVPIRIDLKDINADDSVRHISQPILYNLIQEQLLSSTQLKSFSPEKIEIRYYPLEQKELPVHLNGSLNPAQGYIFPDTLRIDPAFVTAYGDRRGLDTLSRILTVKTDKKEIRKELNMSVNLEIPKGIRLSQSQVNLNITVEEYTEKILEIPLSCSNLPEDRSVRFFPSTVELHVQVGLSHYSDLQKSEFEIITDYNQLVENNSGSFFPKLTRMPESVINYRITPDRVEFLIEQK